MRSVWFVLVPWAVDCVLVDPTKDWGTWEGWGVSLSWWANILGSRDDIADLVFTMEKVEVAGIAGAHREAIPGLGLNIARYNLGASGWRPYRSSSMAESPVIPHWKQIEGLWLDGASSDPTSSSWNWTADANQRAMLQKAHLRGANHLELFSNSPMWWMLNNHNPSGAFLGSMNNLPPARYHTHSVYLATVAAYAKENWGLEFTSVDPFNEPMAWLWSAVGTQEGCHFDKGAQEQVILHLADELERKSLSTVITASDEDTYDQALDTWNSFSERVKSKIGKVNVHGYQGVYGAAATVSNPSSIGHNVDARADARKSRTSLHKAVAGRRFWNSEYADADSSGMVLAMNLLLDIHLMHNTAWCYWQIFDADHGWGLIRFNPDSISEKFQVNAKYFVFAHFTRHIRPGMKILDSGDPKTVAAYDAEKKILVLVTHVEGRHFNVSKGTEPAVYETQPGDEESVELSYDLGQFGAAKGPVTRWSTGAGFHYVKHTDTVLSRTTIKAHVAANTIHTLEVENVHLPDIVYVM